MPNEIDSRDTSVILDVDSHGVVVQDSDTDARHYEFLHDLIKDVTE